MDIVVNPYLDDGFEEFKIKEGSLVSMTLELEKILERYEGIEDVIYRGESIFEKNGRKISLPSSFSDKADNPDSLSYPIIVLLEERGEEKIDTKPEKKSKKRASKVDIDALKYNKPFSEKFFDALEKSENFLKEEIKEEDYIKDEDRVPQWGEMVVSDDEEDEKKKKNGKMDEEETESKDSERDSDDEIKEKKGYHGNYEEIDDRNFTEEMKEIAKLGLDNQEVDYYVRKRGMSKQEIIDHFLFAPLKEKYHKFKAKDIRNFMYNDYMKFLKDVVSRTIDLKKYANLQFGDDSALEDCLDTLIKFNSYWPVEYQKDIDFKPLFKIILEDNYACERNQ